MQVDGLISNNILESRLVMMIPRKNWLWIPVANLVGNAIRQLADQQR